MYVAFLIYCIFLSYCLQLVSYPYFITDCLFIFSEVEFFFLSLFRLVLVWYWHWWQGLWKLYGIKDFNIIKTFLKEKKSLYRDIYCYHDIKCVISWYKNLVISPTPNVYVLLCSSSRSVPYSLGHQHSCVLWCPFLFCFCLLAFFVH